MLLFRHFLSLLLLTVVGANSGCSTHAFNLKRGRDAYRRGDLETAAAHLEGIRRDFGPVSMLAELDMAVVELAQGAPEAAALHLSRVKFDLQECSLRLIHDGLGGFLDAPKPQPYEAVMIDNLLAICLFAIDQSNAADYTAAAQEQLASWTEDPLAVDPSCTGTRANLPQPGLVDYIGAQSPSAALANAPAVSPQPVEPPYRSVSFNKENSEGIGELRLLALVGESPEIAWTKHTLTSQERELALAYAVASDQAPIVQDYLAVVETVATPSLPPPAKTCPRLQLFLDAPSPENHLGETATLLNVRELAEWQFKHASSLTTPQALVEQAIEELGTPAMMVTSHVNQGQALFYRVKRAIVGQPTFRRGPEIRWALLPLEIQGVTRKLPTGKHTLQIGLNDGGRLVAIKSVDIEIKSGKPATVTVVAPNEMLHVAAI